METTDARESIYPRDVSVPNDLTYVGAFLTFACKFNCSYCINKSGELNPRTHMSTLDWIRGLNRLDIPKDRMVPITISGGEPSCFQDWLEVIANTRSRLYVDLLTNLDFDIDEFMDKINPEWLQRDVPYASIRVSYHPEYSNVYSLLPKIGKLQKAGYSIGLFMVDHPAYKKQVEHVRDQSSLMGIDFRTKTFLGKYEGKLYGDYKYPHAVGVNSGLKVCKCKTTEILIAPNGNIHRCHHDLYSDINPVTHILDDDLKIEFPYRDCYVMGHCNPCDIKLKNNRWQIWGACSVEIKEMDDGECKV